MTQMTTLKRSKLALAASGVLLTTIAAILVTSAFAGRQTAAFTEPIETLELGSAFDGVRGALSLELEQAYGAARVYFDERQRSARSLLAAGNTLEWVAIIVTAVLTLLAGLSGRIVAVNETPDPEELKKRLHQLGEGNKWVAVCVAVLAGVSSVCIYIGSELESRGEVDLLRAREIHGAIHDARAHLLGAPTEATVLRIIRDLQELTLER